MFHGGNFFWGAAPVYAGFSGSELHLGRAVLGHAFLQRSKILERCFLCALGRGNSLQRISESDGGRFGFPLEIHAAIESSEAQALGNQRNRVCQGRWEGACPVDQVVIYGLAVIQERSRVSVRTRLL
jgi:hypothetical protein